MQLCSDLPCRKQGRQLAALSAIHTAYGQQDMLLSAQPLPENKNTHNIHLPYTTVPIDCARGLVIQSNWGWLVDGLEPSWGRRTATWVLRCAEFKKTLEGWGDVSRLDEG